MLGKVKPLTRYKVVVLSLKPRKGPKPAEDAIFLAEEDTIYGYGYSNHLIGKYFDVWFTRTRDEDAENFITLGRILSIEATDGPARVFTTKLGRFIVEEVCLTASEAVGAVKNLSVSSALERSREKARASFLRGKKAYGRAGFTRGLSSNPAPSVTRHSVVAVPSRSTQKGRH